MVMKEKKLDIGVSTKLLTSKVFECAEVVKLVDAVDSKSSELTLVPVRVRPSAPYKIERKKSPKWRVLIQRCYGRLTIPFFLFKTVKNYSED